MKNHEIGMFDHAGERLPTQKTALAVWRLVRRPLKLRRISSLASTAHRLSPAVRGALKVRAIQSLAIALDCTVQAGRAGQPLTANRFIEALAERWSAIYRRTRDTWGTDQLWNFKPETVVAVREELVGQGVAYAKIWEAIGAARQTSFTAHGLYTLSAPIKDRGRTVKLVDDDDRPLPLLTDFDGLLDADLYYRRDTARGPRLLLAADEPPPRKISQHVAGERPYDIMHIGQGTENTLARLEAARVFFRVPELLKDIAATKAKLAASEWPAIKQAWDAVFPVLYVRAGLDEIPQWAAKRATAETRYWAIVARWNVLRARKAYRGQEWRAYMAAGNHKPERDRYNALKGRLASMEAIREQVQVRGIADDADVEIKSSFYKHRTRRFQAGNVWPSEASSGEETVLPLDQETGEIMAQLAELRGGQMAPPRSFVTPQRVRWFKVRKFNPEPAKPGEHVPVPELEDLAGLDVSGSQAQILAVVMGLRDVEGELQKTPFKTLVATSARLLHRRGTLKLPKVLLDNDVLLENVAKAVGMPDIYGAKASETAQKLQSDPERYGPGLDTAGVNALLEHVPVLKRLRFFLTVCEALGAAAYQRSPTAGVTVVDPLDEQSFAWNPPRRRKTQIGSGAFKLYVGAPVVVDGDYAVDEDALTQRIAPGLVHMLDALFAATVVAALSQLRVHDVVAIHDAFLVPGRAFTELRAALGVAGQYWLPKLGPFYDVFERYLPEDHKYGGTVRQWRATWEHRVRDAGWPDFATKREGATFA